jgi:hypothetical protein
MVPPAVNPQLPSKSSRMPEEILFMNFNLGPQGAYLRLNTKPYEFIVVKTGLQDRYYSFKSLFEKSLKDFPRPDNDEMFTKMFERKCIELIRNSCAQEFLEAHARQLATVETFDKAMELIAEIIGEESEEERKREAQIELENLARNVEGNEKFSTLLQRIKSLVRVIDSRPDVINFMTDQKFKKCIEPSNLTFLQDHCQHNGSSESIAAYLDARNRFKLVKVAATDALDLRSFMNEQSELLRSLIKEDRKESEKLNASKNAEFSSAIESLTASVNELKMERAQFQASPQFRNTVQSRPEIFAPNPAQNNWAQNGQQFSQNFQQERKFNPSGQNGPPMIPSQYQGAPFCRQCGQYGHIKRRCPQIGCHKCGGRGHVQADCNKPDISARAQIPALARSFQETRQFPVPRPRESPISRQFSGN